MALSLPVVGCRPSRALRTSRHSPFPYKAGGRSSCGSLRDKMYPRTRAQTEEAEDTGMKTNRPPMAPVAALILLLAGGGQSATADVPVPSWKHLSSKRGQLPEPNGGRQQTACVVFDVDGNGTDDIVVAERTQSPAVVWLGRTASGWQRYVIDASHRRPEAGGWPHDVDGDGDLDLILGGDARSDELWWYENPAPALDPSSPWTRRIIKRGGGRAHHDQIVADLLGTGRPQLVFWNQGARALLLAEIPPDPRSTGLWPLVKILDTSRTKTAIKQEGMAAGDVDGDGRVDLLAGIYWLKHQGGKRFTPIQIADHPGRIAAGRFKPTPAAQIVLAPGDGNGPLLLAECQGDPTDRKAWTRRRLLDRDLVHGHTLAAADINADGHLDIFTAEMHTPGRGEQCTAWILYGHGDGRFTVQRLSVGIGNHDSRLGDVNGDGRLDIVTKPYTWDTPRIDVWLNQGPVGR
ncbi:MAG TPA: VCBS repeat-containing protein [Planctomycetes bacterium]|nr:VCBS repeat-containing protein [Planctomycetota bacterium]